MSVKLDEFHYYDFSNLDSHNGTFNFLVGSRGLGKTFGIKKKVIKKAIEKGDQFIYLRRYKNELIKAKNTFFADIEYAFPDYDFKINGYIAVMAPITTRNEKKRTWTTIGYFIALSTAQNEKSVSYPNVKTIIFDEFIIERGVVHYLPNESVVFNNFYSTVDRNKDKTKAYFLANSVSIMNPYFIAYKISPDLESEFVIKAKGFVVCHFPNAEDFKADVFKTKFGKFIEDSEYAEYAIGNKFADNTNAMVSGKNSHATYIFTLETINGRFSVWIDYKNNKYFIQEKLPKVENIFTLVPAKMDNDKTLMVFTDRYLANLRAAFRNGNVYFDVPNTRNTFTEIFKR